MKKLDEVLFEALCGDAQLHTMLNDYIEKQKRDAVNLLNFNLDDVPCGVNRFSDLIPKLTPKNASGDVLNIDLNK